MTAARIEQTPGAGSRLSHVRSFSADHEGFSVDATVETNGGTYHRVTVTRVYDCGRTERAQRKFMNRWRAFHFAESVTTGARRLDPLLSSRRECKAMNGEKLFGNFGARFDDKDAAGTFKPPKYKPKESKPRGCKGSGVSVGTIEPDDDERYHCPHCKAKFGRGYLLARGNAAYLPQHEPQQ